MHSPGAFSFVILVRSTQLPLAILSVSNDLEDYEISLHESTFPKISPPFERPFVRPTRNFPFRSDPSRPNPLVRPRRPPRRQTTIPPNPHPYYEAFHNRIRARREEPRSNTHQTTEPIPNQHSFFTYRPDQTIDTNIQTDITDLLIPRNNDLYYAIATSADANISYLQERVYERRYNLNVAELAFIAEEIPILLANYRNLREQ